MTKFRRTIVVATIGALAVAALAAPATAHRGRGHGKKPMGTIASFDGTTLTVTLTSGETATATVDEGTKVKVEHRGHHERGNGHGNPSNGSADDLTAGTFVLRMKVDDEGAAEKIRVRPAAHDTDQHGCATEDEADETATEDEVDETATEDEVDETSTEDESDEATTEDVTDTGDEAAAAKENCTTDTV